jgi:SMC interacting uncharacterized protein involved in chromosome segregation
MTEHNNYEAVEQFNNDTAEHQSKKFDSMVAELRDDVEEMDPLPTPDEAELGELCRQRGVQFKDCELVNDETKSLVSHLDKVAEQEDEEDDEGSILEDIEAEFEGLGGEN